MRITSHLFATREAFSEDRHMNDVELESLLTEAGYQYDPITGQYTEVVNASVDSVFASEQIADELEIPLEDLQRWESLQQAGDASEM